MTWYVYQLRSGEELWISFGVADDLTLQRADVVKMEHAESNRRIVFDAEPQ